MNTLLERRRLMITRVVEPSYSKMYLTFKALETGSFSFSMNPVQYSLDGGITWTTLAAGASTPAVAAGREICWKASGLTPITGEGIGSFSSTGDFDAYGNVMSLRDGDNFASSLTVSSYQFKSLFQSCAGLKSAEHLILPATTLSAYCYHNMFRHSGMTVAPKLPATNLAEACYIGMMGYTAITKAPALPATTLRTRCYQGLFDGCSGLTVAPELPAQTLVAECYYYMFQYCSNLNYVKCLATNVNQYSQTGTSSWLEGVASSGTFVMADGARWGYGDSAIPRNWTRVTAE